MKDSPAPPILIVGSGALACLFAARLSAIGTPVSMLGTWKEGLQVLKERGVRLLDAEGGEQSFPVEVVGSLDKAGHYRYALVLVKSWQTERAARQLAQCLDEDGLALTLQNGLGNRELLVRTLGKKRVALGITTTGASLLGPGLVRPGGEGIVALNGHLQLPPLARLLKRAGFNVESTDDAQALLWGKLVVNAAINPLTALLETPNGELLERPPARELMAAVAKEAAAVAVAIGIQLPYPDPVDMAERVARRTAANRSSMLQDIQRGAPTEIDAICGAIVQAGEASNTPTPINRTLWQLVKAKEKVRADVLPV